MKRGPSIRIDQSRAEKGTRQEINDSFFFLQSFYIVTKLLKNFSENQESLGVVKADGEIVRVRIDLLADEKARKLL